MRFVNSDPEFKALGWLVHKKNLIRFFSSECLDVNSIRRVRVNTINIYFCAANNIRRGTAWLNKLPQDLCEAELCVLIFWDEQR